MNHLPKQQTRRSNQPHSNSLYVRGRSYPAGPISLPQGKRVSLKICFFPSKRRGFSTSYTHPRLLSFDTVIKVVGLLAVSLWMWWPL